LPLRRVVNSLECQSIELEWRRQCFIRATSCDFAIS